ncbi:MAG: YicC family protein [Defluviicoccus sp.]|nr:YicC family protein [Defluviicoccus sp.]MDE0384242.1 YicC family protein [Defluviicoccus sp.]
MAEAQASGIAERVAEPAAMLQSMTGFARAEGGADGASWAWEARSVNARNLDIRVRLPHGQDALEPTARGLAAERFSRGSLSLHLSIKQVESSPEIRVNEAVLERLAAIHRCWRDRLGAPPARLEALMALPGVLERVEADETDAEREARHGAIAATLEVALDALAGARRDEGRRIGAVLERHLDRIGDLAAGAASTAALQPARIRDRVREQVAALLDSNPPPAEDRLAQEVAYLAARADMGEEIDRLVGHVAAARELLAEGGPVGRRLDFLCQEFNREANTLCSKSTDLALTRIGLDLKAAVEGLREQVQNLE